jgi:LacI family transcriptional regulator
MQRVTLLDVARAAGVGVATVDRVLSRRARVRVDTERRVLAALQATGYLDGEGGRQRRPPPAEVRVGFLLQRRDTPFYRLLGEAIAAEAKHYAEAPVHATVEFMRDLEPHAVVARLQAMARKVQAIALVAADHPLLSEAIAQLREQGVAVFTLLSSVSAPRRAGYVGLDQRKVGRTAAWAIARATHAPGPVAIMVGSHRYIGHELCEIGFRSYLREHAPQCRLLEPLASLEEPAVARGLTRELLRRQPDLRGLFVAGGGIEGVIAALREEGARGRFVLVAADLTAQTRAALVEGYADLVISNPRQALARAALEAMVAAVREPPAEPVERLLAPELWTPESV